MRPPPPPRVRPYRAVRSETWADLTAVLARGEAGVIFGRLQGLQAQTVESQGREGDLNERACRQAFEP